MCDFYQIFIYSFQVYASVAAVVFSKDKIHIIWMLMNQLLLLAPVNWKQLSRKIIVIKCGYHVPFWKEKALLDQ